MNIEYFHAFAFADPERGIADTYVTNRMGAVIDDPRDRALRRALSLIIGTRRGWPARPGTTEVLLRPGSWQSPQRHQIGGGTMEDQKERAGSADWPVREASAGAPPGPGAGVEEPPLPLRCAVKALGRCALRTAVLLARRGIHQPVGYSGRTFRFADGTTTEVYRETVVERPPAAEPVILVVCFRLRRVRSNWGHALFRWESELNTVLFAGFPGLISKLWLRHDQRGVYRGLYEWDDPALAVAYVRALWWVLALVSVPGSIHYAVLPGLRRDELLRDPTRTATAVARAPEGDWWRLVGAEEGAA
jgi:hypothetical protein